MRGNNGFIGKPKPNRNIGSQYSNSTEIALNSHKDGSGIRDLQSNFHEVKGFNGNAGFFGGPRIPQVAKIDNTTLINNQFRVQLQTLYNSTGSVGGQQSISIIGSDFSTIGTERNTNITVTVSTKGIPRGDAIYFVIADDDNINSSSAFVNIPSPGLTIINSAEVFLHFNLDPTLNSIINLYY